MLVKNWLKSFIRPSVVDIEGMKIKIPLIASDLIRGAIFNGSYEAPELELVKNKLSQDDIVMEVGTGLGLLSTYCAKQIGGDKVFTFEGNPALEQAIKTNYALNQVEPKLEISLVGEHSGFSTFYVCKNFWSSSIIDRAGGAKPIIVPVVSFNEKVRKINPTFLLLDIEGGEFDLVKYADFHNIRKLMIELHSWILTSQQVQFVRDTIAKAGFYLVEGEDRAELYFER